MTNKPTRRLSSQVARATTKRGIWSAIAAYSSELAHVAGPLLDAIGQTANAIERAERQNRALEAAWEEWEE